MDCFSVDNALVQPASPLFVGACAEHNSDCGASPAAMLPGALVSLLMGPCLSCAAQAWGTPLHGGQREAVLLPTVAMYAAA